MQLLLVEDDALLGDGIYTGLKRVPYEVDWVKNGESALDALHIKQYDLIILDLGLPHKSGTEVLAEARHNGYIKPILILTAQDSTEQKVAALDAGADDYLVKPFDFAELCARIRALTRRSNDIQQPTIQLDNITLDLAQRSVMSDNKPVTLSRREFELLEILAKAPGKVFSKEQLEQKLYSWTDEVASNAIEVHIHHLRKKLATKAIKTARGVGYYVEKPIH